MAGRITPALGLNDQQWREAATGVEQIAGAVLDATGLRTVVHHHCATYVETPAEIDRLLALTDPALVGLCLDSGHVTYGGGDPRAILARHRARVWHVHFKDCEPAIAAQARQAGWDYQTALRHGLFCELGRGTVDFPGLLADLNATGFDGWIVVEQDVLPAMGAPLASATRNREYLAGIGV
jgi:inosose dehydratase